METAYLIDGSGYIFRAFYAIQSLSTRDGFPTNALLGFTRMLLKTLSEARSEYVSVIFDAGKKTFRHEIYPQYKANRKECPEDLLKQMPYFREISQLLGIPVFELAGFEADDIIGTFSHRLRDEGDEVVIVSGDKDVLQLVGGGVSVWDTMKDQRFGAAEVATKLGVRPERVIDYLALVGDASDNIPGLDGVGPKTALQLLEKFENVERIVESADQIEADPGIRNRKKIADTLRQSSDLLQLSKRLVTISLDVPLISDQPVFNCLKRQEIRYPELIELLERFELSSLISDLGQVASKAKKSSSANYITVDRSNFTDFFEKLSSQAAFAFDLETDSLDTKSCKIVGISFCWSNGEAFYLPLGHINSSVEQVPLEQALTSLSALFSSDHSLKIGHNLKFDISVLATAGVRVCGPTFDTMIAEYLLDPDQRSFNLTVLVEKHLGLRVIEFTEVTEGLKDFSEVSIEKATEYGGQDAHYAWLLRERLAPAIEEAKLSALFSEVEMPLVSVLAQMEQLGIRVDKGFLEQMSKQFAIDLATLESQIHALAGEPFNINSPKQLGEVLFTKLGISTKGIKRTKLGFSTDSSVLEKLAPLHPLAEILLSFRMLHKLKSTYTDALAEQINPHDGRLHTKFNQTGTGTGRLSSSEPNLQNIPIQSVEGRRIREAFVAEAGSFLISADYSQIELRLLAHLSGDKNMIDSFRLGIDIHTQTAREILGLGASDLVSSEARRIGKTINFGIVYGMGPYRLARDLKISVGAASEYIASYFRRYPGVREYFDKLEDAVKRDGEVRTLLGRRRVISSIDTSGRDDGFAIRAGLNAPIQGSAADVIKLAMLRLDSLLKNRAARLLLQIHDELLFEAVDQGEESRSDLLREVKEIMESVITLSAPLKVEVGYGSSWGVAH